MAIAHKGNLAAIRFTSDGWTMYFELQTGLHVLADSEAIATQLGNHHPKASLIAVSDKRIYVGIEPDPPMFHFNDYLFALHALEDLGAIALYDPDFNQLI